MTAVGRPETSELADLSALPATTRMLLNSEGSTTQLLESLVGVRVHVHVVENLVLPADQLPRRVRDVLHLADGERSVLRGSQLRVPDGRTVSVNQVAFRAEGAPWLAVSVGETPLGHQLRDRQAMQFRRILRRGLSTWPAGGSPCAFKEYVINCADGATIYVHETFNPEVLRLSTQDDS